MKNFNKQKGISLIGVIFLGLIIVLVLSYFHISIKSIVESPTGQDNISYVRGTGRSLWDDYLAKPASYLWNDVWLKIIWRPLTSALERNTETYQDGL